MLEIGFAGPMASGKGTGTELVKRWYPGSPSMRFSDSLRALYADPIFPFAYPHFRSLVRVNTDSRVRVFWRLYDALNNIYKEDASDIKKANDLFNWIENSFLAVRPYFIPSRGTRIDLQELSTKLRSLYREDLLEREVRRRLDAAGSGHDAAIIEGIRRNVDIGTFLADPQKKFRLVYIDADPKVRWKRYGKRNENPGDGEMSFERFLELSKSEAELQIVGLRECAHLVINNDGPPEFLEAVLRAAVVHWVNECK